MAIHQTRWRGPMILSLSPRESNMEWTILAVVYMAIGVGVFAWCIRGNDMIGSDQKKRSTTMLILFPQLCLFWPFALISEIKRRRAANQATNNHSD